MKKVFWIAILCFQLIGTVTAQAKPVVHGHVQKASMPENSVVLLVDRTSVVVERDYSFATPETQQFPGQIENDTDGFSYSIDLPDRPQGEGLRVFTVEVAQNYFGQATLHPLEQRFEQGTSMWQSIVIAESIPEVIGGALIVYAPDDGHYFTTGFGEDGLLLTDDDPVNVLARGYTVVYLNGEQFQWVQEDTFTVDLHPIPNLMPVDYTHLDYVSAFDALVSTLKQRYAYTEFRGIDWEMLQEKYRARVSAIQDDSIAYYQILSEMALEIGDLHVFAAPTPELVALMNPGVDMSAPPSSPPPALQVRFVDGYGIATVNNFSQQFQTMAIWQDFLVRAHQESASGMIIDLRGARGGDGALATIMAGHFFTGEAPLTFQNLKLSRYDSRQGEFSEIPLSVVTLSAPKEIDVFTGEIILLTGSGCMSACELFTYLLKDRATIMGTMPTAGAGGAMNIVKMPGNINFYYTFIRATNSEGQPAWERDGIAPELGHEVNQINPGALFALINSK